MAKEEVVEQFVFDYYIKKCLDELNTNSWELTEESNAMLKVLMTRSIYTDHPGNLLKAHLLIIVCSVIRLKGMGLEEDSLDQLGDDSRTEIIQHCDNLLSSIQYLHQSETCAKLRNISRECLFHIYALLVKIICMGDETIGSEDSDVLDKAIAGMRSVTNLKIHREKNILKQCEEALSQPGTSLDLPPPHELWSLVRNMILEASLLIEPPCEDLSQLKRKMRGEEGKERLSRLSDLLEIMGKTPEECENEQELNALREKCEQIRKQRQHRRDTSQEHMELSSEKQEVSSSSSKLCTPKKTAASLEQAVHSTEGNARTPESSPVTDSGSGSKVSRKDCQSKKYPTLPSVNPRWSLINFCNSRKPPSHMRGAKGKWLLSEEEEFIVKTLEIGEGNWAKIKSAMRSQRSNVQLKDKWRQISLGQINKVARNHDLVYRGTKKS